MWCLVEKCFAHLVDYYSYVSAGEFRIVATRRAFDGDELIFERDWDERIERDCL